MTPDSTRIFSLLDQLVGINTENPPGREIEAAMRVMHELESIGFDVGLSEFKPGRANVVGVLANGPGPAFAFNSHLDVVPAGEGWSSDPFRLKDAGDRFFGRGACDAKGPITGMLEAMRLLAAKRDAWSGTVLAVFVADEEVGSEGARTYARSNPDVAYVLIGEPTSNSTVVAHKGSLRPTVRVHGEAAHSASPDLGENAIFKAGIVLGLIEAEHRRLRESHHDLLGSPSLTVTRLTGGHADNVVPYQCDIGIDRRMIPGETEEAAIAGIEALLKRAHDEHAVRAEIVSFKPVTGGPTETDVDHPIVLASLAAGERHGCELQGPQGFQGGCDLVHFRSIGAQGTVIGPGDIGVAHKPDEFVPKDELVRSSLIYHDVAFDMLTGGTPKVAESGG